MGSIIIVLLCCVSIGFGIGAALNIGARNDKYFLTRTVREVLATQQLEQQLKNNNKRED